MNIEGLEETEQVTNPCFPQTLCDLCTVKKSVELWGVKLIFLRWSAAWLELRRDTDHGHKTAAIPYFTRFQPLGFPHLASAVCSGSQAGQRTCRDPRRAVLCMPLVVLQQAPRCYLDGVSGVIALLSSGDERQQSWRC